MLPFPMPMQAKLYKKKGTVSLDRSGQVNKSTDYEATPINIPNCLFYGYTGGKQANPNTYYDQTAAIYFPPGTDVDEGDLIKDITGKNGVVFEAGPFEVLNSRMVVDHLSGRPHHLSVKVRGSVS